MTIMESELLPGSAVDSPGLMLIQGVLAAHYCDAKPARERAACIDHGLQLNDALVEPVQPTQ